MQSGDLPLHEQSNPCLHGIIMDLKTMMMMMILELALLSEESGYVFHSYVKIHYSVPKKVQQLTGITNKSLGLPFGKVMAGLTEFLHREQAQSETIHVIIAHG